MQIPAGSFSAYLFDCDGTLADSLPLHYRAWQEAIAPWGASFPKELFLAWSGVPVPKTVEQLNEKFGLQMPVDQVTRMREELYLELLPQIKGRPEVLEQVRAQKGILPLAVVSGSPRASVMRTLSFLGIEKDFQTVVGAEDAPRGKPYPDPYLLAASRLGVKPESCLVFEDADLGVESAKSAGMKWVKVPILF